MPTGLATTWGYPIGAVAGNYKTMLDGDHPLTYELGMTSYPPSFAAGYFQSPLNAIPTRDYKQLTSPVSAFGKKRRKNVKRKTVRRRKGIKRKSVRRRKTIRITKKMCKKFLRKRSRNPITGNKIKRGGSVYKKFIKMCKKFGLKV